MLKRPVSYVDFDGTERTDILYFNLNEVEGARLEVRYPGGLENFIENLDAEKRPQDILDLFEHVLSTAYGFKSEDGRHFIKTDEETAKFKQSAAYSALFMELMRDADAAAEFFKQVVFANAKPPAE